MPILPSPQSGIMPKIDETAFVADSAYVIGDVEIGPYTNVWFSAVVRGDWGKIIIGEYVSVQDNYLQN